MLCIPPCNFSTAAPLSREQRAESIMADTVSTPTLAAHGAARLPAVEVESYNVELKDDEGFVGDRASKGAFRDFIENWRKPLREIGHDPLGDEPSSDLSKKQMDELLAT